MCPRQLIMFRVKKIAQHSEQIEVHKPWPVINQKLPIHQHFLEGYQTLLQLTEQFALLLAPLVETAAAELALLVPDETQPVRLRNKLAPVNVGEFEARAFNVVFDVAPEEGLHALQFPRKQAKRKLLVQILRYDL